MGRYAWVCRAGANRDAKQAVSAVPEGYITSLVGAPSSLHDAIVDVTVQGTPAKVLLDTGASEGFTHEGLVGEIGLKSSRKPCNISLVSSKSSAKVCCSVQATVKVFNHSYTLRMVVDYSQTINRFTALGAYPLPKIEEQVNNLAQCSWFSTLDFKSAYYQISINPEDKVYTAFEANGKLYQYRCGECMITLSLPRSDACNLAILNCALCSPRGCCVVLVVS